jgi:Domain of unknown function (DUF4169)
VPISHLLTLDTVLTFPFVVRETVAHRPAARHRQLARTKRHQTMADIVNLRRARKDKERRERDARADANRRRFGRTKAEKTADRDTADRGHRTLEGKRLEPTGRDHDKPKP